MIGPAVVLAVIVGLFHVSAYVFIRGRAGARVAFLLLAAILGAWAGDAIGSRLGIDPVRVGDFSLLSASIVAWLGIALVAVLAVLLPDRRTDVVGQPRADALGAPGAGPESPVASELARPREST